LTLATWMRAAASLAMPLRDTLALACVSSLAAIALALGSLECAARYGGTGAGRALKALYVPLFVPQIAFLFGLEILFSYARLDGTFFAVAIVHLVFVFPYVLLSLSEPWRAWDPRYGHAIRALGRGPDAVFWMVRLPMLFRAVLTAIALGFAVSVALYLPTLLIGAGRWPTVTTEAVALASGGDPRLIGATGLTQAALPFLGFAVAATLSAFLFRNRRRMRTGT
jgi:putative thiamine transport system permease protein